MKRSDFLKGMAAAGLLAGGAYSCQTDRKERYSKDDDGKQYRWKMVTTWPPNFPILGDGCKEMARWVEQMSGGQMTIHVYGGGELVPPLETFEAVSIGGVEMGSSASYYWAGKIPAAQFFAAVPFGLNAQQMNAWLEAGGGMELWRELYAPYNLIPFNAGNTGLQMGGWYNKEINTIEDFKGLKMRIPGLGGKVLNRLGGSPILSPGSEIYTNLERGVIDASEWLGPFHDSMMGFHEIAKYYYYPGWHECGTSTEMIVNKAKYEALPTHLQVILTTAIARLKSMVLDQFEAENARFLERLKTESDVEVRPFPQDVLKRLKVVSAEVVREVGNTDEKSKKVYDSFIDFAKKMKAWSRISESAYYNMMEL